MVFTLRGPPAFEILSSVSNSWKFIGFFVLQLGIAIIAAVFNIVVIGVLINGRKKLMKNHFYIIASNLIVCTSLKAIAEIGFNIPFSIFSDYLPWGHFPMEYEMFIFYTSIFADYGVLFISMALAVNRFWSMARSDGARKFPVWISILSCVISCQCSITVAFLFFLCQCQYNFSIAAKMYFHRCFIDTELIQIMMGCLIYLPHACALVVLFLYHVVISSTRRLRQYKMEKSKVEMNLLKQSLTAFIMYTVSIIALFVLSFIDAGEQFFDIIYIENLLNLSIAAVYPVCLLAMPGEIRSIITKRTNSKSRVGSLSMNNKKVT
ncbi:hypothetical protein PRIPAC_71529 [Pristionchus pacificus]|uniref:Uncharacterized protein n=1 Tax=Pristionchus pacificus TaxID=54126 RepID=A0A2A6C6Z3_PRIPA|nr:hypothetical protein PRIPAC_71529 [Pristionchus pacificus]|eukprot:PDM73939.1 hypothetical protein PRIPAC_41295 [Pristionchus pacificus]